MSQPLRRPDSCPACEGRQVRQIYYGYPPDPIWKLMEEGVLVPGGCGLEPWQPDWECRDCGHRWFDEQDPAKMTVDPENGTS